MRPVSGMGLIVDGVMVLRAEPPLVPTLLHTGALVLFGSCTAL